MEKCQTTADSFEREQWFSYIKSNIKNDAEHMKVSIKINGSVKTLQNY